MTDDRIGLQRQSPRLSCRSNQPQILPKSSYHSLSSTEHYELPFLQTLKAFDVWPVPATEAPTPVNKTSAVSWNSSQSS